MFRHQYHLRRSLVAAYGDLFFSSLSVVPFFADVTARISGTATDPSGVLTPNAIVTVIDTQTGVKAEIHTDSQGFYSFRSLPVGRYDLRIQAAGFKDYKETGLVVDVNSVLIVDAHLQLGEANQQVTASAAAVQVETTNTQMGEVITDTKMTTVPLNGRSYTDVLALQPGVTPVSSGQYHATPASGDLNSSSLSVSGQRESASGFMVNGGNVNEGVNMGTAIVPEYRQWCFRLSNSRQGPKNWPGRVEAVVLSFGRNKLICRLDFSR